MQELKCLHGLEKPNFWREQRRCTSECGVKQLSGKSTFVFSKQFRGKVIRVEIKFSLLQIVWIEMENPSDIYIFTNIQNI
jgi:hypothetical protein